MIHTPIIRGALAEFERQVVDQKRVLCALAFNRQKKIAMAESRLRRKWIDGVGEMIASIDTDIWHRLIAMHGTEKMRDPEFLRVLLRDNPELRVKSYSPRTTIFMPGQNGC